MSATELRANDGPVLSTEELVARVVALSQSMRAQVFDAIERMQSINRGIHLLSMNARLEAVRAGHAGAGFGVVAQELTRLSASMKDTALDVMRETQGRGTELDLLLRALNGSTDCS